MLSGTRREMMKKGSLLSLVKLRADRRPSDRIFTEGARPWDAPPLTTSQPEFCPLCAAPPRCLAAFSASYAEMALAGEARAIGRGHAHVVVFGGKVDAVELEDQQVVRTHFVLWDARGRALQTRKISLRHAPRL